MIASMAIMFCQKIIQSLAIIVCVVYVLLNIFLSGYVDKNFTRNLFTLSKFHTYKQTYHSSVYMVSNSSAGSGVENMF